MGLSRDYYEAAQEAAFNINVEFTICVDSVDSAMLICLKIQDGHLNNFYLMYNFQNYFAALYVIMSFIF